MAHKGARDPGYDEAKVSEEMKKPEIELKVALGLGKGRDRVLTCDLDQGICRHQRRLPVLIGGCNRARDGDL